ncbi:MAG: hypothetical protein WCT37_03240 [Patescibacteria group bacterium]|jgi:hypothetical protein
MGLDNQPIDIMSLLPEAETPEAAAEKVKKEQELLTTWQVYLKQAIGQRLADLAAADPEAAESIINGLCREFIDAGKRIDGESKPVKGRQALVDGLALYGADLKSPASEKFSTNLELAVRRVFDNLENLKNDWRDAELLKHEVAAMQRNLDGLLAVIQARIDELPLALAA